MKENDTRFKNSVIEFIGYHLNKHYKETEMEISQSMLCSGVLDALPDAVFAIDRDHRIIAWNAAMERITLVPRAQAIGKAERFYAVPFFGEPCLMLVDLVLNPELEKEYQRPFQKSDMNYYGDGTIKLMSRVNEVFYWSQASPVFDDHGHVIAALEILRDKNSDAVIESKRNLRRITDNMSDLVSELDCHGNVVFASPSHYKVLGYTDQRMMTITLADLVHCEDLPQVTDALKKSLQTGRTGITHHRCRHRDGHYVWTETVGNPIWQDGKVSGIILSSRDITDRKQLEQELRYISTHDALTSVYNRTYFEEELIRLENGRFNPVGMIMFDLDGLKLVNDTMGHEAGDRLLKNFAQILQSCFRSSDVVSRVGGDEFAVLLPETGSHALDKATVRIDKAIKEYNQTNPYLPLSVSVGKAIRMDNRSSLREIYKEADNRMYRNKLQRSGSAHSAVVNTLLKALQTRDNLTEGHGERMRMLVALLGKELKLSETIMTNLQLLARFHNIGKVGIPDRILFKKGRLTEEEFREMKRHSEIGQRIALASPELSSLADLILKHHEYWDGSGYPFGLKGEQIPLECRIIALVDAYDTMTHDRPYSRAISSQEALQEIARCSGTQFDPSITTLFLKLLGYSG
jgi:diguanylate cyclase (GGDEF)-like protein/PAS domain S-box-containing protein